MVAGDIVNTASRLQSAAAPGAVLVGEATYRASGKAIAFESAGPQSLKGKAAPVPAWRALRVVAERGGRNRSETLEAPFVGREPELRLLKDMLHATSREKRARLVSITGVAGIGKSRLAWELEKYADGVVESVRWHSGRSPSYGEGVTFWALGEMVRSRAGLLEIDDQATTRDKIAAGVREYVTDESEQRWIESALLALLGAGDPPPGGRDALFAAWRTFFERISERAMVTMVFEDLHWADAGLLDFIDHLVEWSRDFPIYVVTLARPELLERRPDWGAAKRNFTAIGLEPLAENDMRELLTGLVPGLPEATTEAIVRRADGIPLYAVEMVRALVADGRLVEVDGSYRPAGDLGDVTLPETLHALIAARLDSLDLADRSLLQDAAVLGQSFSIAALSTISGVPADDLDARLRSLVRKEILGHKVDARSPERGQYSFVQGLFRDVAYNTLARPERKARHLAAARWFESLGEEELAGALAAHYLAAYRNAPEGAEAEALAAQARISLRAAGDRAAELGSHEQAVKFYDQALTVNPNQVEEVELLVRSADAATSAGRHDDAETRARKVLEIETGNGDTTSVARATASLGWVLLNGYRTDAALTLLEPAYRELSDVPGEPGVALGGQLARAYFFAEKPRQAVEIADRVLEAAEHANLIEIVADTLITKGSALCNLGRSYEGLGSLRTGQQLAETHGLATALLRAVANRVALEITFDAHMAFETARAGLAHARRMGWSQPTLSTNFAAAGQRVGEWDAALEETARALERSLEPVDWAQVAGARYVLLLLRGVDAGDLRERLESLRGEHVQEAVRLALHDVDAWRALASGELPRARELWLEYAAASVLNAPDSLVMSAHMAIWDGDASGLRDSLDALDATGQHGPVLDLNRRALHAGLQALSGRAGEALPAYRDVTRSLRDADLPLDEAFVSIDLLRVLGPDNPDGRAAGARAREIFVSLGAVLLLTLVDGMLAEAGQPVSGARRPAKAGSVSPA
jgi:tetratricopeptide (TPR) repeat protein